MISSFLKRLRSCTLADSVAVLALSIPLLLIIGRAVADMGVVLVAVLFLCHSAHSKDWSWLRPRWVQVSLALWFWLFISAGFAMTDHVLAFKRAVTWVRWPLVAAAIVFWCSQRPWWSKRLSQFLIILLGAVCIDTIIQYVFGISLSGRLKPDYPGRLTGPFNRLVVGIFLARLFWPGFASVLAWAQQQQPFFKRTLLPLGFIGLITLVVLLSGERMAFLLMGLSLSVFFLFAKNFRKPLLCCGLPLVFAIIVVVATQPNIRARAVEAQRMLTHFDESGYGVIFNNAITAWKVSPITGVGPKNFVRLCEERGHEIGYADAQPDSPAVYDCARHPHNPYLEWLVDTGLVGLILFSALVMLWGREAIQRTWQARGEHPSVYLPLLGLTIGLIPLFWPLQGNMSMFINWNGILVWWSLGVILSGLQKRTASSI